MEEKQLTKQLFKNYLRDLYIEMTSEEVEWAKGECSKISGNSWNVVLTDPRQAKSLLSYYLVSKNCPEYKLITTTDLIEHRFDDENSSIRELIHFPGIVVLRHSSNFIRNKLMFETIMNIVSERSYKEKPVIVISDTTKDEGGYLYYSQESVSKYIPSILFNSNSGKLIQNRNIAKPTSSRPRAVSKVSSKPLANKNIDRATKEAQMVERSKAIEEGAKNAV